MVWAGGFAAWLLFYSGTAYLLEVFSVFVIFAVVFAGLAGLAVSALAIKKQRSRRATVAVMIILGFWCVWLYAPVRDIGLWVRFAIEESRYVQALDALVQGREPSCAADKLCEFDAGPPARAAFSWGGLVDNWVGVVIDPSNDIMAAGLLNQQKTLSGSIAASEEQLTLSRYESTLSPLLIYALWQVHSPVCISSRLSLTLA